MRILLGDHEPATRSIVEKFSAGYDAEYPKKCIFDALETHHPGLESKVTIDPHHPKGCTASPRQSRPPSLQHECRARSFLVWRSFWRRPEWDPGHGTGGRRRRPPSEENRGQARGLWGFGHGVWSAFEAAVAVTGHGWTGEVGRGVVMCRLQVSRLLRKQAHPACSKVLGGGEAQWRARAI